MIHRLASGWFRLDSRRPDRARASRRPASRSRAAGRVPGRAQWWVTGVLCLGLCAVVVMCAWQSDDAYITFRTVRNFWSGDGLTWNPGERVQAYTHPLWMLVALGCYGAFHEVYYSTLAVSWLCGAAAVWIVVRAGRSTPWIPALSVLLLATSAAFVDYATSGLETPLLYLLLAAVVEISRRESSVRRLLWLSLLASAVGLTRLDALLLVLPATLWAWWKLGRSAAAARAVCAGLLPLAAWEMFSLVYYGSWVPNTALAKLNVEIGAGALAAQGLRYFTDSLAHDPVTLTAIAAAIALAFRPAGAPYRPLTAGLACYLAYVLRIGGDFMSGRFFAAPFVMAVAILAASQAGRSRWTGPARRLVPALLAALALYGAAWPESRWRSGTDFGAGLTIRDVVRPSGIADERAYYYPTTGLVRLVTRRTELQSPGQPFPPYPGAILGARFARSRQPVAVWDEAGFFGYFAGAKTVIDIWALADPLLARIPFRPGAEWRVGHYSRPVPAGYLESRRTGRNVIEDPGLAALFDALVVVTRGPLFTRERWREIWRLHTGHYAPAAVPPPVHDP